MATQVQWRGGSTAEHATFTGAAREVTVDTQKQTLVVHDGSTVGGEALLREDGSNCALNLGSVTTPAIKFSGDTNTGIYSPGADQVAVATNGVRRLLISDGQIQADTLFSVAMGGVGFQTVFRNGANEDNYLTQGASGFTLFRNHNGSEYMRLDSSGRLGIGTSSPNESLHVNGAIRFTSSSPALAASDGGLVDWVAATGELRVTAARTGANSSKITFITYNSGSLVQAATIDSSGRVGIGSNSPGATSGARLHVQGSTENSTLAEFGTFNLGRGLLIGTGADGAVNDVYITYTAQLANYGGHIWKVGSNELARLTKDGQFLVGTSTSRSAVIGSSAGWSAQNQIASTSTNSIGLSLFSWSNYSTDVGGGAGVGPDIVLARSNSNTEGTQAAVTNGMLLGRINFNGSDGTAFANGAYISAASDGQTWASGDCPGRLVFSTTADGASSPTERMRIKSSGIINFSNAPVYADNAAALAGGLVAGDVYRKADGTLMITF
jgi:hypothetical protein